MFLLLNLEVDEIAILGQFANEGVDLAESQWRPPFQIAADETVIMDVEFECRGGGILDGGDTVFFGQGEQAQDTADGRLTLAEMDGFGQFADVISGTSRPGKQLNGGHRRRFRIVLGTDTVPAPFLADMLA